MPKNKIIIILVVFLLLFGSVYAYFKLINKNNIVTEIENTEIESVDTSGRYIEYRSDILSKILGKRVIYFFYANWCPTCNPVNTELQNNTARIPEDVVIVRVNYNDSDTDTNEKKLAEKFNVVYQHTFVQVDEKGSEIGRWNGGGLSEILGRLK